MIEIDPVKFGAILRKARAAAGLTLVEAATKAKISPSYLCRLENNEPTRSPSTELVRRLAKVFALSGDDLAIASGRVPEDVARWLIQNPHVVARLRREMGRAA